MQKMLCHPERKRRISVKVIIDLLFDGDSSLRFAAFRMTMELFFKSKLNEYKNKKTTNV